MEGKGREEAKEMENAQDILYVPIPQNKFNYEVLQTHIN